MHKESYLKERFKRFGDITKLTKFHIIDHNTGDLEERTLLSSDDQDNILIHYHTLMGSVWTFHTDDQKQCQKYIRTRLKSPKTDVKYISPKGTGLYPFFNGAIIHKYQTKEKIKTLVLIEGEFKSLIASYCGLDCVGLGSIHGFYADKNNDRTYYKELAPEIIDLIRNCQIENIIYLTDADTLSLKYKTDTELSKRPKSFMTAVYNFREATKKLIFDDSCTLSNFYFSHIKNLFDPASKGIDDLIENNLEQQKEIINDLNRLDNSQKYFDTSNLKNWQKTDIQKYFGLIDYDSFYETYSTALGTKEFIFENKRLYYDGENVRLLENLDLKNYIRIGTKFFKAVDNLSSVGSLVFTSKKLQVWDKTSIVDDFGKKAITHVKKYDGFINYPNWIDFQHSIGNNYNLCAPLPYKPVKGNISCTIEFINHISNNTDYITIVDQEPIESPELGNRGTMILDYLSLLITQPTQMLPVPCLLSEEQETGKTTFAELICKILEGNSIILRTVEFTGVFNSHWAGKSFIAIDEGDFEDKRTAKDHIKYVSTSSTLVYNQKGVPQSDISNYTKLMICSNAERNFLNLTKDDKRFWIIPVKTMEKKDDSKKREMFKEIPAFVAFLIKRKIHHPKKTRNWFDESLIMDENWMKIVKESKAHWKQEVDEFIQDLLEHIDAFGLNYFEMPADKLLWNLKTSNNKFYANKTQLKDYLVNELKLTVSEKTKSYTFYPFHQDQSFGEPQKGLKGRVYKFDRNNYINDPGQESIHIPVQIEMDL